MSFVYLFKIHIYYQIPIVLGMYAIRICYTLRVAPRQDPSTKIRIRISDPSQQPSHSRESNSQDPDASTQHLSPAPDSKPEPAPQTAPKSRNRAPKPKKRPGAPRFKTRFPISLTQNKYGVTPLLSICNVFLFHKV